jgi:cyclophilin family peptidyl-prolyl cis-trans isomerase
MQDLAWGASSSSLTKKRRPISSKNFLQYAKDGFLQRHRFHRVIPGFMIQGGGFTRTWSRSQPAPRSQRSQERPEECSAAPSPWRAPDPHSATAQFFINHKDNDALDYPSRDGWGYAVFGKVTKAWTSWTRSPTCRPATAAFQDVPVEPVVIQSVKIISEKSKDSMSHDQAHHQLRCHHPRTRRRKGAENRRKLPRLCEGRPLRQHDLPPRHQRLHDPGRRLGAGHEAEGLPRPDRRTKPPTASRTSAAPSPWRAPATRTRPPPSSSSTSPTTTSSTSSRPPAMAGATACLARWLKASTWSMQDPCRQDRQQRLPPGRAGGRRDHRSGE